MKKIIRNNKPIREWYYEDKQIIKMYRSGEVLYWKGKTLANSVLHYTTTDNSLLTFYAGAGFYDADGNLLPILRNEMIDGVGEIEFDGVATSISSRICYNNTKLKSFTIPDTIREIGNGETDAERGYCFYGCTNLQELIFPELNYFGRNLISESGVKHIELNGPLSAIGTQGCQSATNLTTVIINEGVVKIGVAMFRYDSKIKTITVPSTVTSLLDYAFSECTGLTALKILPSIPPGLGGTYVFYRTTCPIYVPDESVDKYKTATNWTKVASRIKPMSEFVG